MNAFAYMPEASEGIAEDTGLKRQVFSFVADPRGCESLTFRMLLRTHGVVPAPAMDRRGA